MKLLFQIFWTFVKIGPVTFGGGYAMISLIEREVVERHQWIKEEEIADVFALAESIPGAIAINSATFIGHRLAGVKGAIAAMFGLMLPTFIIVTALSIGYLFLQGNPKIDAAFQGIRAAIVALIIYAAYKIGRTAILDWTTLVTSIVTVVVLLSFQLHPIVVIMSGAVAGIVQVYIKERLGLAVRMKKEIVKERDETKSAPDYFIGDGI